MCIFTGNVKTVSDTRIFARVGHSGQQYLAYSMKYRAKQELAMVLPIPVKAGTKESGVKFMSLKDYEGFFAAMRRAFPSPVPKSKVSRAPSRGSLDSKLVIHEVGSFQASFVPTIKDFSRLDERFRLPAGTWERLPNYKDFGFAVFKLKHDHTSIHPMAFRFPTATPQQLFFPTVHIHDGKIHPREMFDHELYCQCPEDESPNPIHAWRESTRHLGQLMDHERAQGLIDPNAHCFQRIVKGRLPNKDTWV